MGSKSFKTFPNEIFNVYANCDKDGYYDVSNHPFNGVSGDELVRNDRLVNCTFNIISPTYIYTSDGTLHVIGYGSRIFKKLSFGFKFDKKFLGRKSIKLRAMPNDPSYIREKLSTELFRSVGVPVQEGVYSRLFINGDSYGLYYLIDSLSSKWIKSCIHGDAKAKIGISYQMVSSQPDGPYSDLRYKGEDVRSPYILDEYEEEDFVSGDEKSKWKYLINFTKKYDQWVKTYGKDTSDKAVDELKNFLNIESTLRLMAIESLILALDNFWLVSSNTVIYYNPERKNYQFIPFDFDQTLVGSKGTRTIKKNYMQDCITWAYGDETIYEHYFTKNLLNHPKIKQRYDVILAKTIEDIFNLDTISSYVHAIADLIKEDVEWSFDLIDQLKIGYDGRVNHFTLEDFNENIEYNSASNNTVINDNEHAFGILEWVDKRSNGCRISTSNVDTSKNENISDNVNIEVYVETDISYSIHNFNFNVTIVWIVTQDKLSENYSVVINKESNESPQSTHKQAI
ncbi:hypothetical protein PIROE2DRAFT_3201 [Piromyces sp. E2]|nr:hypothetical protein PIROE2DRAFT_3201 [Piromyces sp. E2]|eukprot:OUM68972.1 hypothetical protein PIROE2DRAFT_3201 [Piromyces sp. E2]